MPSLPRLRSGRRPDADLAALGLAGLLLSAGTLHFLVPKFYDQMIPSQLPGTPRQWTYGSGVAELAVGAAIALPSTRRRGGLAAATLFVAVLPGNIQMAVDAFRRNRSTGEKAAMLARLPIQGPLVWWGLRVARR